MATIMNCGLVFKVNNCRYSVLNLSEKGEELLGHLSMLLGMVSG